MGESCGGGGREDGKERRRERGGGMPGELELLQPQPRDMRVGRPFG